MKNETWRNRLSDREWQTPPPPIPTPTTRHRQRGQRAGNDCTTRAVSEKRLGDLFGVLPATLPAAVAATTAIQQDR